MISAPILAIDRHRINVDGEGVRTLVAFHGCPLRCRMCLNEICHDPDAELSILTVKELIDEVRIDDCYFRESCGGVTFGGGEPLLYGEYIASFREEAPAHWSLDVETSLNVDLAKLDVCADSIDRFFVDIKCTDATKYRDYTGCSIERMMDNLRWLIERVGSERICCRVPRIPGLTNDTDCDAATTMLRSIGIADYDIFDYITPSQFGKTREGKVNAGKTTCSILKDMRLKVARSHGLLYTPRECNYTGPCAGTCPQCDAELELVSEYMTIIRPYTA